MEGLETLMIKMGIGRVIGVPRDRMRRRVELVELVLLCSVGTVVGWGLRLRTKIRTRIRIRTVLLIRFTTF